MKTKLKVKGLRLKSLGQWILILIFNFLPLTCLIFIGCERSPFENTVEFVGKVYYGTENSDGKITVLGPLPNARVIAAGYNGSATTDSSGKYTLEIKAHRRFSGSSDEYTLEASGTSAPDIYPTANYVSEQITVYGRPGDTIKVRDFLLYKHKETQ
ncbi:MAG TPA: hypothetical protein DCX95_00160 [Elusimicrobia bacterium]|nr:hypothetical protein [Elusimicrobiota bacterium]